jgi:hypothetical protein
VPARRRSDPLFFFSACGGQSTSQTTRQREGKTLFARARAGCHTLTATDNSKPGGDPAIPGLTIAQLATYVRVMPVHLTPSRVDAVATYLHDVAVGQRNVGNSFFRASEGVIDGLAGCLRPQSIGV